MDDKWQIVKQFMNTMQDTINGITNKAKTVDIKQPANYNSIPSNYINNQKLFYGKTEIERMEVPNSRRLLYLLCASVMAKLSISIIKNCKGLAFVAANVGIAFYYFPEIERPILNLFNNKP
jgi:hypothetical protein